MSGFRGWGWRGPGPPVGVPFGLNDQSPQAQGLMAWWPALYTSGAGILRDRVRDRNCNLMGTFAEKCDPSFGRVKDFVSSYYVSNANISQLVQGTLSIWVSFDSFPAANSVLLSSRDAPASSGAFQIDTASTTVIRVLVNNGDSWIINYTSGNLNVNQWYLGNFTWSAGHKMYLNGVLAGSDPDVQAVFCGNPLYIGALGPYGAGGYPLDGQVAEVRLSDCALPPGVIWQQWNPDTRWDLYRPLVRRLWHVPIAVGRVGVYGRRGAVALPGGVQIRGI
jgi:hypothetical protein